MTVTLERQRSSRRSRVPSVDTVTCVIVGLLAFLIAVRPAVDNDLWFHLRTADWMLDHHRWVGVDPFTHTRPDVTRVQTDWLAQLGYYAMWRLGGLVAVGSMVAAIATAGIVVLYRTLTGSVAVRAGVVVLTAASSSIFWSARPQMVTFLGTVVASALLRRWRLTPQSNVVWWLVPVFLVWVNCHGGVVYGVLILLGTLGGELVKYVLGRDPLRRRELESLGLVAGACLAVLAVNPSGWRVYGLPFHQVAASTRFVQEYQPPSPLDPVALPFFVLLALTVGCMAWRWRDTDPVEVVLVGTGAYFALQFTRGIPFFAVLAAPVLARILSEWRGEQAAGRPITDDRPADPPLIAITIALALIVVVFTSVRLDPERTEAKRAAEFPVAAVDWINANQPDGELFNTFDWGGYLMWEAPDYRVSVDGRTDVYDEYLEVYYDTIRALPGWEDELDREGVSTVLLERGLPLAAAMEDAPGWRRSYVDPVAVVFTRRG